VYDIAVFVRAEKENHVSALDCPAVIRNNFEQITRLEDGIHAGAGVAKV
jgi:hypothetical protein